MLPPVTKKCEDHSTDRNFCFVFYCDACGAIWESELYPFSMRNTPSQSEGEKNARVILWRAEHDAAYERANLEAMLNFNKSHCIVCRRLYLRKLNIYSYIQSRMSIYLQ